MRAFLLILFLTVAAAAAGQSVTVSWTAPTSGSPVAEYLVQILQGDTVVAEKTTSGAVTTTNMAADPWRVPLLPYVARVRGIDAQGRDGEWSEPSPQYVFDPGPPSAPTDVTLE